jgi:hypothetical protein
VKIVSSWLCLLPNYVSMMHGQQNIKLCHILTYCVLPDITCWDRQIFCFHKAEICTLCWALHVDVRNMTNETCGSYSLNLCSCTDWVRRSMVVRVRRTGWQAWVRGFDPGLPIPERTRIRNRTSRRVLPVIRTRIFEISGCYSGANGDIILLVYDAV